jgi:DNA repair and recombination protein RAD52
VTFGNNLYSKTQNENQQNQNYNQRPLQNNQQQQQRYQNDNVNNNRNSSKVNQNGNIQQQQQPYQTQNNQSFDQYEYQGLYNLGLDLIEQNGFLVVTGENQYAYKDAIKACGFRFDSKSKSWYKQLEQRAS